MNKSALITIIAALSLGTATAQDNVLKASVSEKTMTTESAGALSARTIDIDVDASEAPRLLSALEAIARAGGYSLQLMPGTVLGGTLKLEGSGRFQDIWNRAMHELDLGWSVSGKVITIDGRAQNTLVQLQKLNESAATAILKASLGDRVVVTPTPSGSLVLTGKPSALRQARELLAQVESAERQKTSETNSASATQASATAAANITREIWNVNTDGAVLVSVISKEVPGVNLSLVGGRLLLSGAQELVTSAKKLLEQLDPALSPAKSERVKLKELSAQEAAVLVQQDVPGIKVSADARSGALTLTGSSDQIERAKTLISEIDVPNARVEVQVRIHELTDLARQSLGLNLNLNAGGLSLVSGNGGISAGFDPTKVAMGFNLLPSLDALESQGLTKRIYQGQVSLGANQSAQSSAASAPAASSTAPSTEGSSGAAAAAASSSGSAGGPGTARIQTGGVLELNIPGSGGSETIEKTFPYGLTLEFSNATVSPSGNIEMQVHSAITGAPTSLDNPQLLNFTNSQADASVRLKNGETAMLAGVISKETSQDNSGVPLLARVPGLGALFGKQGSSERYTQLLVIIHARAVR